MALCGRRRWRRDRRVRLLLPAMYPETLPQVRMISRAPGRHWGSAASPGYGEHERGRAQAAPKHGVHGLAQCSNPRAVRRFQGGATSGGTVWRGCGGGYGKHGRAPAAKGRGARPRSRHRTAASTGSPKKQWGSGHRAFREMGTAPVELGARSAGLCGRPRCEGDRAGPGRANSDGVGGRDGKRGFVNTT